MQAKNIQSQASTNFDQIFENVSYYSRKFDAPLEPCFTSVLANTKPFQLHNENLDDATLGKALQKCFETDLVSNDEEERTAHKVWVTCGETGMGKSSFINALLNRKIAVEAQKKSESQTSDVCVYDDPEKRLCLIDTPGFYDTRLEMSEKSIIDKILAQVEKTLRIESKIDALILFWAPTVAQKFRLTVVLDQLEKMFGTNVLESIVLVVNKYSEIWEGKGGQCYETAFKEVNNQLKKSHPQLPITVVDLKAVGLDSLFKTICDEVAKVKPFQEEYFLKIRRDACWQIYQDYLQRLREEKELAERIGREYQKKFAKEQQKHQAEMAQLTANMKNLGLENKRLGFDLQRQKQDFANQESRHNQKFNELNNNYSTLMKEVETQKHTIDSQKQEVNTLIQQNRTLQNTVSTSVYNITPNYYSVPTYTPTYPGGSGRCWGCSGGPGHPWSSNCRGGY